MPRIEINRDDHPALAHLLGCDARHHARATRDIEHAVPRLEICEVDDEPRRRAEHGRDEVAFVDLGRAAAYLPLGSIDHHAASLLRLIFLATRPAHQALRTARTACSESTSSGSLVRAQYRPYDGQAVCCSRA
jgi:hypothetical protein